MVRGTDTAGTAMVVSEFDEYFNFDFIGCVLKEQKYMVLHRLHQVLKGACP